MGTFAVLLAACASGPTDLPGFLASIETAEPSQPTAKQPDAVERNRNALLGVAQQRSGTARAVGESLPSAMALAIIRQQQQEEARRLLAESGAAADVPVTGTVETPTATE